VVNKLSKILVGARERVCVTSIVRLVSLWKGELIIVTDDSKNTKMVPIVIPASNQQALILTVVYLPNTVTFDPET